jgi:hypothetical protein
MISKKLLEAEMLLNEHSYPHILSNLDNKFEILNFGISGTSIASQLEILLNPHASILIISFHRLETII